MALETVGVRAVVEGIGPYERNAVKVQRAQEKMGASAVQAAQKSSFLSKALGQVAATASGFLVARGVMAIPQVLGGIISTSRDLELQMKKANIVFGDQIEIVNKWAKENAKSMGLSAAEATNLAARFGDLLVPMGFARKEAAEMSSEVVGLAGALAEWSGGQRSAAEVADILAKAMVGEREALKSLGINITEAEIKARLAAGGFTDLQGAQLQQTRATITQNLIMEKSVDAQTAFAEGTGSAARKQAEMSAQMQEAKEAISLALTPALLGITGVLATHVVPALVKATQGIEKFIEGSEKVAVVIGENQDLVIAFGAVALGAILVPRLLGAITALWKLHAVLRAIAIARHMNMLQVVISSLAMGPVSLPVLAIGAAAAALALLGLGRRFFGAQSEADRFKRSQEEVAEALKEVDRASALSGLDAGRQKIKEAATAFVELEAQLNNQQRALGGLQFEYRNTFDAQGAMNNSMLGLLDRIAKLRGEINATELSQKSWREATEDMLPGWEDILAISEETGISIRTLSEIWPTIATEAAEAGQSVEDFAADAVDLKDDAKDLGDALGGVVDGLSGVRDELSKLKGVETKEEAALRLQITARKLTISGAEEWVRVQNRELTPAEEAQIEAIENEIEAYEGRLELLDLTKQAGEDWAVVMNDDLMPSTRDQTALMQAFTESLSDENVQAGLAAIQIALLEDAVTNLREKGLAPAADYLEDTYIPNLKEAAGIEVTTEAEFLRAAAEQAILEHKDLLNTVDRQLQTEADFQTGAAEVDILGFKNLLATVDPVVQTEVDFLSAVAENGLLNFMGLMDSVDPSVHVEAEFLKDVAEADLRNFLGILEGIRPTIPVRLDLPLQRAAERAISGAAFPPGFQHGGIVQAPPGQPVLGLLHGGERVLPSATAGVQPISVSVTAPISMQDPMDWSSVRRAVHQEVDNALDSARSQSLRAGVPLRSEIG